LILRLPLCIQSRNVQATDIHIIHQLQQLLQKPRGVALLQHQWVPVHTGHQTQANGSPYGFGNLPLVLWSQTCVLGVLYPAHFGHVFRHHGEVLRLSVQVSPDAAFATDLVLVDGVDTQNVEGVALGLLATKFPLLLLGAR
jgi:hypothetical protein